MRKFLKSLVIFLLLSLTIYVVGVVLWGEFAPAYFKRNINYRIAPTGHMRSRIKDVQAIKSVDILFLGSSHAYRGFDTRIFKSHGFRSFNLGSSAQTPIQTKALLEKYLDSLNPKLVIYDVYPATFSFDGVESSLDLLATDEITWNTLKWVSRINHIKIYNTMIYSFFRQTFGLDDNYKEPIARRGDTYIRGGGFVERELEHNTESVNVQPGIWDIREKQYKTFEQILKLLDEKNIDYALVQTPVSSALYQSNTENTKFDSIFNSHGQYINFNELMNLNDTLHFYDADHLNQTGVELFNQRLIEELKENGVI